MESKDKIEGEFEALINKFIKDKFVEEILTRCPHCNKMFVVTVPVDSIAIAESLNEFKTFVKHMLNVAKQEYPYGFSVSISWRQKDEWFKKWFGEK